MIAKRIILVIGLFLEMIITPSAKANTLSGNRSEMVNDFGGTLYVSGREPGQVTTGAGTAAGIGVFAAFKADTGMEFWRIDGPSDGTYLLKDICPGANGQWPNIPMVAFDTGILFSANNCSSLSMRSAGLLSGYQQCSW